jgi:hypothetical protein
VGQGHPVEPLRSSLGRRRRTARSARRPRRAATRGVPRDQQLRRPRQSRSAGAAPRPQRQRQEHLLRDPHARDGGLLQARRRRALPLLVGVSEGTKRRRVEDRFWHRRQGRRPQARRELRVPRRRRHRREGALRAQGPPAAADPCRRAARDPARRPRRRRARARHAVEGRAQPQEPTGVRCAAQRVPRRPRQSPRARANRALVRLASLSRRRRHARPADGRRRARATGDGVALDGLAAPLRCKTSRSSSRSASSSTPRADCWSTATCSSARSTLGSTSCS